MVLANPEISNLPGWVIALVAAGGLAAALSTAAGLLLVISTSISHDLLKKTLMTTLTEKQELFSARLAATFAVIIAGFFWDLSARLCGAGGRVCVWPRGGLHIPGSVFRNFHEIHEPRRSHCRNAHRHDFHV